VKKKQEAEDRKNDKIKKDLAQEQEAKKQLDDMEAKVKKMEQERVAPQPQYYSQPSTSQPQYSQPAPQPQSYNPPAREIGFWERAHDAYRVVHKTYKMRDLVEAAEEEGSRRSVRRALKYSDKFYNEVERYGNKYSNYQ
jgi:hypothetical protein